jgi:hypothetical protein
VESEIFAVEGEHEVIEDVTAQEHIGSRRCGDLNIVQSIAFYFEGPL